MPDRAAPLLNAAENVTVPLPLPRAPAVTASHEALLAATHSQPSFVTTSNVPVPPPLLTARLPGDTANRQEACADDWVMANPWPATVSVAARAPPVLTVPPKAAVPDPVPPLGGATVSHGSLPDAVHSQPGVVVTVAVPAPPSAPKADADREMA